MRHVDPDLAPDTGQTTGAPQPPRAPVMVSLENDTAIPNELTGRASASTDDLTTLFRNDSAEHFDDGFSGGSDDDTKVAPRPNS